MRQKLRLIQAIMGKPRYLILDEPFDGLDSKMKIKVKDFLDQYIKKDSNRILIYSSHDEHATELASDILVIMDGNFCFENGDS